MISDEHQLLDLFLACDPSTNEHRLAFTIVFTPAHSRQHRGHGTRYIAEAYRTVRDLLQDGSSSSNKIAPITDMVLAVEGGYKKDKAGYYALNNNKKVWVLHVHGFVKTDKTFSSDDLERRVKGKKKNRKLDHHRGVVVKDYSIQWQFEYIDEYSYEPDYIHIDSGQNDYKFNAGRHPVDKGWVAYMVKIFPKRPPGCKKPAGLYSTSNVTRTRAKQLQQNRTKQKTELQRSMFAQTQRDWSRFAALAF